MENRQGAHQNLRVDFVHLPDLEARLPLITGHSRMVVFHESREVAEIRLGNASTGEAPHFIIRPPNCTREMLRTMEAQFALKIPEDGRTYEIDPNGIGGHFVQGVSVSIAGHTIKLPILPVAVPVEPEDQTQLAPLLTIEPLPVSMIGLKTIAGSKSTTEFSLANLTGSAAAAIGLGTRTHNEDHIGVSLPEDGGATLFVIDGSHHPGFEGKGVLAAQIVSDVLVGQIQSELSAFDAMDDITSRFTHIVSNRHHLDSPLMGACTALAEIQAGTVRFAHVGDCKGRLIRAGKDGNFKNNHETHDHTYAQELRDKGYKEEEIPAIVRHVLSRNISANRSSQSKGDTDSSEPIGLKPGDLIVLASDGMNILETHRLLEICREKGTAEEIVKQCASEIEAKAQERTSIGKRSDNFSLIVFKYKG